MKPEARPARPRYHNETVYRSAERLIAAGGKRRARRWPPPMVFLVGLAAGLGLAFFLLRPPRDSEPRSGKSETSFSEFVLPARLPSAAPGHSVSPTSAAAAASDATTTDLSAPAPAASLPPPTSPSVTTRPPVSTRAATPASTSSSFAATAPTLVTRLTTQVKLRGELRTITNGRTNVEFDLYLSPGRADGAAEGLARLLDGPRVELFRVSGRWFSNSITLREIKEVQRGSSQSPYGYEFVLDVSESPELGEVTGFWSHGGLRGTLQLKILPPSLSGPGASAAKTAKRP